METLKLIVQIIGLIGVIAGVYYASKQIRASSLIHKETLDWNRKTYTEELLREKTNQDYRSLLKDHFETTNSFEPIPLEEILSAFKKDNKVKFALHSLLNRCEIISRGIQFKTIDEDIIKKSNGFHLIKIYLNFELYIHHIRPNIPNGLGSFMDVIEKWKRDKFYDHCVKNSWNKK